MAQLVRNLHAMWETWVWSMGWEDLLENGKATHSIILDWRTPWTVHGVAKSWMAEWLSLSFLESLYSRNNLSIQFSSVTQSCPTLCNPMNCSTSLSRPPCPSPTPRVHSDLTSIESVMPSSHLILCHPFSSCPQSLPASESFPMSQLFALGVQSTGASALASFLTKKSQGWSPSEWTGWISLQSKELSGVFSNTTVQKRQFFGTRLSSQSNSQIHTGPLEKS